MHKLLSPKRFSSYCPLPARTSPRNVRGFDLFSLLKIKETLVKLSTFLHGIPIPDGVRNRQFKSTNFYTELRRQMVSEYNAHVKTLTFRDFPMPLGIGNPLIQSRKFCIPLVKIGAIDLRVYSRLEL